MKWGDKMKNKVKEYREKYNMTQEELAMKSKVSRNTISSIETDADTNITYKIMERIAEALNEKVAVIFFNN